VRSPLSKKKKRKKKKLAKSKTRKGGLSQKWASRWIENLKGRSRQKLGAYKNIFPMDWKPERAIQAKVRDLQKIIQKNDDEKKQNKNKDRGITSSSGSNGRMHFVLIYKWRLLPMIWWMATLACGLIDGVFCRLWFDWWRLLPLVIWLMPTLACGLIDGDFCLWFDGWRLLTACDLIDGVFCLWFD